MKTSCLVLLIAILLNACDRTQEEKQKPKKPYIYFLDWKEGKSEGIIDASVAAANSPMHYDSIIETHRYTYKGISHTISEHTNFFDRNPPFDGVYTTYKLDTIGVIFLQTGWPRYAALRSDNDSINDIIQSALEQIIYYKNRDQFQAAWQRDASNKKNH